MNKNIEITWFGRCCFLVKTEEKSFLFDPYDLYLDVDIGKIDVDVVIISSTWHDHGHVGASPKAHIYSYAGKYNHADFTITGIAANEERGSPTIVFNLKYGPFSITNFADLGSDQDKQFRKSLSKAEKNILAETNIAFIRPSIEGDIVNGKDENIHNETALNYCDPAIIFPEHYFPEKFILKQIEKKRIDEYQTPNVIVNEMIKNFGYPVKKIKGYSITIKEEDLINKHLYKFDEIHPQVKYISPNI